MKMLIIGLLLGFSGGFLLGMWLWYRSEIKEIISKLRGKEEKSNE